MEARTVSSDFYRNIISIAKGIQVHVSVPRSSLPRGSYDNVAAIPDLHLGSPPNLADMLNLDGVPRGVSERLVTTFEKFVKELQMHFMKEFKLACERLSKLPRQDALTPLPNLLEQLASTFADMYMKKVSSWINDVRGVISTHAAQENRLHLPNETSHTVAAVTSDVRQKQSFNMDFVPFMEAFFEKQQFPTKADKILMAKKSGMSYRQIHVWYQNRRNRLKKATSENSLRNLRSSAPEIEQPSESVALHVVSSCPKNCEVGLFHSTAPHHAYPTPYPPEFSEDPFPCRSDDFEIFKSLEWPRRPTSKIKPDHHYSMEELVNAFDKLSLGRRSTVSVSAGSFEAPGVLRSDRRGLDNKTPCAILPICPPSRKLAIRDALKVDYTRSELKDDARCITRKSAQRQARKECALAPSHRGCTTASLISLKRKKWPYWINSRSNSIRRIKDSEVDAHASESLRKDVSRVSSDYTIKDSTDVHRLFTTLSNSLSQKDGARDAPVQDVDTLCSRTAFFSSASKRSANPVDLPGYNSCRVSAFCGNDILTDRKNSFEHLTDLPPI